MKATSNEVTYLFSIDYNANHLGTGVIETRAIKRVYQDETSETIQFLKSDIRIFPYNTLDDKIVKALETETFFGLSKEITPNQLELFMDKSCDLFTVDVSTLGLL